MKSKKILLMTTILFLCGCSMQLTKYEYYDKNGEMGYAKNCYSSYGTLYCITDDNWKIEVTQYRKVN